MIEKIEKLLHRLRQVEAELSSPEALSDQKKYRSLSEEHSHLAELKEAWEALQKAESDLKENRSLLSLETDPEMLSLLKEDVQSLEHSLDELRKKIETLLVPPDPNDSRNIIVEIRAGTGGDEAALFVADMARMYRNYADSKKWRAEVLSASPSELGGYKEYIFSLAGTNVNRLMQYEGGTHRVQRVPETEAQGRVHTSAVTVAIMLEPNEEEVVELDDKDLRIETYRASGAGGQHVNTTDSAVRITHIPTGAVAQCQDERSQHKNRDKAMRLLSAKITEAKRQKEHKEMSEIRQLQVGTGDRSGRIRTYNYPQNRITDHRINLTLYKLDRVIEGDMDDLTSPLVNHFHQQKLSS